MRIFIIGFMGSGKSHWGRIWAKKAGMDFYDLDACIEAEEKKTIDQIFEKHGEDYFRKLESDQLSLLVNKENCIISCGGGTPCFHQNLQIINNNGFSVYLKATPLQLFQQLQHEIEKRPLFNKVNHAEVLFFIEQKLNERKKYYEQAKQILDVESLNEDTIFSIINNSSKHA